MTNASHDAPGEHRLVRDVTRLDTSAFDLVTGTRTAIFVVTPFLVGMFAFNQPASVCATIGGLFLANTEGEPSTLPAWVLLVGCAVEAAAFGCGTLAATAGPVLSSALLGIGIFFALLARGSPRWAPVGTYTAIMLSIGVGLPGASVPVAGLRACLSFLGALWVLFGAEMHRYIVRIRKRASQPKQVAPGPAGVPMTTSETLRGAVVLATACWLGFMIGSELGLPRDFWVVATIIFTVRPSISLTIDFTAMMALGTIAGALIAAAVTLSTSDTQVLAPLILLFAILMFSSRGVNPALLQVFLTPFIIILLNVLYSGAWFLALYRVVDVSIGIMISLALVYLREVFNRSSSRPKSTPGGDHQS